MKQTFKNLFSAYTEQEKKPERRLKSAIALFLVAALLLYVFYNAFDQIEFYSHVINIIFMLSLLLELFYIANSRKHSNSNQKDKILLIVSTILVCLTALIYFIVIYNYGWL